jgi:hypothetical protein
VTFNTSIASKTGRGRPVRPRCRTACALPDDAAKDYEFENWSAAGISPPSTLPRATRASKRPRQGPGGGFEISRGSVGLEDGSHHRWILSDLAFRSVPASRSSWPSCNHRPLLIEPDLKVEIEARRVQGASVGDG